MAQRRPSGENPLVGVFMVGLLVVVAGAGIWHAIKNKPGGGGARYGDQSLDPRDSFAAKPRSGGALAFVDAFKRLPSEATSLQKAADQEYDNAARLLSVEELANVDRIRGRNGNSRDAYTNEELAMMRRHGLSSWVRAQAIKWSQSDPSFQNAAQSVYGRSSGSRDVSEMAAKWGEMDKSTRQEMLNLIQVIEKKTRELTSGERDALIGFAGQEYLDGRP